MNKNDFVEVEIIDYGSNGEGIAKIDEFVLFIPYAIVGEKIRVKVLKVQKNLVFCKIDEILTQSNDRVAPICPVFFKCGGCQMQHISYSQQLRIKQNNVKTNLRKICGYLGDVKETISSNLEFKYRNKIQLPISSQGVGFYANNTHDIIPIFSCPLHDKWATDLIKLIQEYVKTFRVSCYDESSGKGELRHMVARYMQGKLMVTLVSAGKELPHADFLITRLKNMFSEFSLFFNRNTKVGNVILGDEFTLLYGEKEQELEFKDIKHFVSVDSFMQVNSYVQNLIYDKVIELTGDCDFVIDAYSGAGLLTSMISKHAKKVIGVEIVESAVKSADRLARINNITNMTNICGDCADVVPKLIADIAGEVTVVLDPPRKGCDSKVIDSIINAAPSKVVYISCNSATLARDLTYFKENYDITLVQPYDMFPQTKHVETLVCLVKK